MFTRQFLRRKKLSFCHQDLNKVFRHFHRHQIRFGGAQTCLFEALLDLKEFTCVIKNSKAGFYIVCDNVKIKSRTFGRILVSILEKEQLENQEELILSLIQRNWSEICPKIPLEKWGTITHKLYSLDIEK